MDDDDNDFEHVVNIWQGSDDEEEKDVGDSAKTRNNSSHPTERQQFLGGVEDDDERMLKNLRDLEREIQQAKQDTLRREAELPIIDEPWTNANRCVAECRFHAWGASEAETFYQRTIAPLVDSREKVWHAYKVEIVDIASKDVWAWFIGATMYIQDDICRILNQIIMGRAPRRINDGEKTPEFNRYILLQQIGHSFYRQNYSLDFFRLKVLPEESAILNSNRSFSVNDQLKVETQAIERYGGWASIPTIRHGRCGLNFLNPLTGGIQMKWGVSLLHLRDILDKDDPRCKMWTFIEVFEKTIKPRAGTGMCYVEYLQRTHPEHVSEHTDWFLSPSCYHCNWYKMVFDGGIAMYAQTPKPLVKGNRFVFVDLFLC